MVDLNSDRGGDVFLYNKVTGARRFEVTNRLGTGFNETVSAWDPGWQVYPADLNADEYMDMFLYDPARGFWIQALNHAGDGTFTYTLGNWDSSWTVVPSDLDGDGLTDMFVYNFSTGVWVKCFVDGSGGFSTVGTGIRLDVLHGGPERRRPRRLFPTTGPVASGSGVQSGGLRDARLPGVGAGSAGRSSGVISTAMARPSVPAGRRACMSALEHSGGGFNYVGGAPWAPGWLVAAGDLNNDRLTDLFLYNASNGVWTEAFSDGAGSFTFAAGNWDPGWTTVAMTDFNEDGRGDLIITRLDGTWVKATNTGFGTFSYAAGNWGVGWTIFTNALSDR